MKVFVLTKRHYTGKDLLGDRYGRMWELPARLVDLGHEVTGVALSYRSRSAPAPATDDKLGLQWHSSELGVVPGLGIPGYFQKVKNLISHFRPDIIWAGSDAPHIVVGERFAREAGIPFAADLYDNFESFALTRRIPGLAAGFRAALTRASAISCVSTPLQAKTSEQVSTRTLVQTIENAIDRRLFKPGEKQAARASLGLPQDALLIGTAGALKSDRGIFVLSEACDRLCEMGLPVSLLVAGQKDRGFQAPKNARLLDLGEVPQRQVPKILGALDVGVVANLDSGFGRYCFPMKLYEMIACGIPIAVAAVGAAADLLAKYPQCLFAPGNPESLARVIRSLLEHPCTPAIEVPTWAEQGIRLSSLLEKAVSSSFRAST